MIKYIKNNHPTIKFMSIKPVKKKKKRYIYNKTPNFVPKINNLQKNKLILNIIRTLKTKDIKKNITNIALLPIDSKTGNILPRFRKLNKYRLAAIQSIIKGMLYHFDINTKKIQISIGKLADECGLSTVSSSGNRSTTRASRLISEFMEPMGFVKCKIKKNKNNICSKEILLTPLFFMLFDHNLSTNLKTNNKK